MNKLKKDDLTRSGAIYINRIRLCLALLFYASVALSFNSNTAIQNTLYLSAITFLVFYGIVFGIWNQFSRVPDGISKILVYLDVIVVTTTMIGGSLDVLGAQIILQNTIVYIVMVFYIVYSAYLLSPGFTLSVSLLCGICSATVTLVGYSVGMQYSDDPLDVIKAGFTSLSIEILKVIFIMAAGILTIIILRMSRNALAIADEQRLHAEESLATIEKNISNSQKTASELDDAVKGMSDFIKSFDETVREHATAFEQISASMEEFAISNEKSAESVKNQFQNIDGLNKQSERIRATNVGIQENVLLLQERMANAREASQNVSSTILVMDQLYSSLVQTFQKVSDVTGIMSDVSDQTNLLALNASIEAARAGEAGRGFAVVADEVSRLADTSSKNARAISDNIGTSSKQMQSGKTALQQAVNSVSEQDQHFSVAFQMFQDVLQSFQQVQSSNQEIWDGLNDLRDISSEIEMIAQEQKSGSQEINQSLSSLDSSLSDLVKRSGVIGNYLAQIQSQAEMLRKQE